MLLLFVVVLSQGRKKHMAGDPGPSKGTVSSVPARFRADSGANLFKQGEIVAGRPCG